MPIPITRRNLIKAATGTALALGPAWHSLAQAPASERVRIGLIGCGGRGRQLLQVLQQFSDVEVAAISDIIEPRMEEAAKLLASGPNPSKPTRVMEHELILERKDIDAVVIATTQHWHGIPFIQAVQAGKHVFVEKPLSHTVVEGQAMVAAAQKSGVVAMMGTQQRGYEHYLKGLELVQSGRLGNIALVECWNYHDSGRRVGRSPDSDPPPGYHWDRWLGPAPLVAFNLSRLNNSWWFDYAGGMMTNWAVHHIDIILWAMRASSPTTVACSGGKYVVDDLADTPDTIEASWEFPNFLMQYSYRGFNNFHPLRGRPNHHGICFHGNRATLVLDRSGYELWQEGKPNEPVETAKNTRYWGDNKPGNEVDGPWQRLFIDCIKSGKQPPVDLADSHRATVCCHLANISYLVGRKLRWDGMREAILGDDEAAKLLSRPRRKGYELPSV